MAEYRIPQEAAHQIAIGLYHDISVFIKTADSADYERFKAEYESRQATQTSTPVKRHYHRSHPVTLGRTPKGST